MLKSLIFSVVLFPVIVIAQEQKTTGSVRSIRQFSKYYASINYAPIDLVLPSKKGLTLGYVNDDNHTTEIEYLKGSLSAPFLVEDIGEMVDERISLIRRNYLGTETFNFSYGLSYHRFIVHIGNKYLTTVAPDIPEADLINVESLGVNIGVGHRWTFSNRWSVAVDWAALSQPIFVLRKDNKFKDYTTDDGYKDSTNTLVKIIALVPRVTLLKLQAGYSF